MHSGQQFKTIRGMMIFQISTKIFGVIEVGLELGWFRLENFNLFGIVIGEFINSEPETKGFAFYPLQIRLFKLCFSIYISKGESCIKN